MSPCLDKFRGFITKKLKEKKGKGSFTRDSEPLKGRCFTNGWRYKIKKGEGKKKKEEKRETIDDIGTNTVSC